MIGTGRVVEVDQAEVVCIEALMHDACALEAAVGQLRVADDQRYVFVSLGATGRILRALQGLQSWDSFGPAWHLWNRLVHAPILVYNDSEAANAAGKESHEADTEQKG